MELDDIFATAPPEGFSARDTTVRLARHGERELWDAAVDRFHYLGFRRFAGRGLRYVFEWSDRWVGVAGWQTGSFKCASRDRWIGWDWPTQLERLHLIGCNTRMAVLGVPGAYPGLCSHAMGAMLRRVSGDWQSQYDHPLLVAESYHDASRFRGTMYRASNWRRVGRTRGFSRSGGRYRERHGVCKEVWVRELRRDARRRLRAAELPASWRLGEGGAGGVCSVAELRALHAACAALPGLPRRPGQKHDPASLLALTVAARRAGRIGGTAVAAWARGLGEEELEALGTWRSRSTGLLRPPSRHSLCQAHRAMDVAALTQALGPRWKGAG